MVSLDILISLDIRISEDILFIFLFTVPIQYMCLRLWMSQQLVADALQHTSQWCTWLFQDHHQVARKTVFTLVFSFLNIIVSMLAGFTMQDYLVDVVYLLR